MSQHASAQTFSRVGRRPVTEEQSPSRSQKLAAEIDPDRLFGQNASCKRQNYNLTLMVQASSRLMRNRRAKELLDYRVEHVQAATTAEGRRRC
jgi:hypothetical protein